MEVVLLRRGAPTDEARAVLFSWLHSAARHALEGACLPTLAELTNLVRRPPRDPIPTRDVGIGTCGVCPVG